jgi:hypothetical protein
MPKPKKPRVLSEKPGTWKKTVFMSI